MLKWFRLTIALTAVLAPAAVPAVAQPAPPVTAEVGSDKADAVDLFLRRDIGNDKAKGRTESRRVVRSSSAAEPVTYMMKVELRVDPVNGGLCAYLYNVRGDPMSAQADAYEQLSLRLVPRYGTCSNSPVRRGGRPAPATIAEQVWREQVTLPAPVLAIAPGFALAGKPAYLEVGTPRRVQATYQALGEAVSIDAVSVLDVDWGDGTVESGLTRRGGPWPDGDISHVYTTAGNVTVTATLRWTASWRVGQVTGTIDDGLQTTGALQMEVRQLQAVRDR